jgi:deoxyribose-phosphate aldolase
MGEDRVPTVLLLALLQNLALQVPQQMNYTPEQIAAALDLAVLSPRATREDIKCACAVAYTHNIKSVCVAPCNVPLAASRFGNTSTVIGFPHGNGNAKECEAYRALEDGAKELDVVINYGRFLDGDRHVVIDELRPIVLLAHRRHALVKAIVEACYHDVKSLRTVCELCVECGVDFVKTSTGFAHGGASTKAVEIMLTAVNGRCGVKASGGIDNYAKAAMYLDMGCTRLGSSKYLEILP